MSDTLSGISTGPLVIRKVDKGKVSADDGGPVSQMQKIALQRVNPDGTRHYLSAAGPMPGTPGVVAPPAPGMSSQAGTHPLIFQTPRVRDEMKDGVRIITDEVDDYLCWTIVGICACFYRCIVHLSNLINSAKFQYTFFDAFGRNNTIPAMPITPFPTLFTAPVYRPANNTIELTVSNFFHEHPTTHQQTPLDVYLGNLGPLRHRVYQATPPGPLTNIAPFVPPLSAPGIDGPPSSDPSATSVTSGITGPPRYIPTGPLHTIVIVEMPPLMEVIKALEEDALPPPAEGPGSSNRHTPERSESRPSVPQHPPSITGRSLPLLFIRSSDGVGYHSGRTITCESVFQSIDLGSMAGHPSAAPGTLDTNWLAAAQAAAVATEGSIWTLRVM